MPTITFSHKKLKFSLAAALILLCTVVSFSFGTPYARQIFFAGQTAVGDNPQPEQSASRKTIFASIFNIFYRSSPDDDLSPSAIIIVNDDGDTADLIPGNGACADAAGKCTLRAAIMEANSVAGVDTINFNFLDSEANQIQLDPNLSPKELLITEAVTINGPGARHLTISGNPATTTADIFNIAATATQTTKISGLTIQKSGRHGINNAGKLELSDIAIKDSLKTGILNTAKLMVNRSLIDNNSNGGIRLTSTSNTVNISNSTINRNKSEDNGAGINAANGDLTLNNVTISSNSATGNGGGLYYSGNVAGINIRNTIIATNTALNGPDIFTVNTAAVFNSRGNNLIGKNTGSNGFVNNQNGDKVGTVIAALDPKLGPLQNNGGQTDTRALDTSSPARDAGNTCVQNLSCPQNTNPAIALNTDQRGTDMPRFFENAVDMGAFETFYPQASITSLSPVNWGTNRGAFELTINGSSFVAGSQVKWNGQNKATTFVSNNQLKANISASDVATAGTYQITVVNPQPNPGQSETVSFPVANCTYSISPTSAPFPTAGGAGTFSITTFGGCQWTAESDSSWIKFNNGNPTFSGTGSATNVTFTVDPNTGAARTGKITVGGQILNITQPNNCIFTLSEASHSFTNAAGSATVFLETSDPATCSWTVTEDLPWLTVTPSSGTGTRILTYSVTANTGAARTGSFSVGGRTFNISQAAGNCTYTINPPIEQTFSASGGSGSFTVTTGAHCQITPVSTSWITVTGVEGNKVNFSVQPNTGTTSRNGTITVGGQSFTVKQDAPCNYTIDPANSPTLPGTAGNGSFAINTTANCSWTATKDAPWITITNPNGTGTGTVNYTVAANPGTTARTGTITVAGKTHTVNQAAGCNYSLNPTPFPDIPAQGGNSFSVQLTTQAGCAWTAQANPNNPWLTVNSGSGSGNGSKTILFTVQQNTGPARTGTVTIAGITLSVTQQSGCIFSLTPTSAFITKAQATHTVALAVNNAACGWTATTSTPWISVDSTTASGNGAQTIKYTVQANVGPERTGSITIAGINFEVKQETGCTFNLSPTSVDVPSAGFNGSVSLTVNTAGCAWTASSNQPWLRVTSTPNGTTSATVTYTVDQNTGAARVGTLTIGGQAFTVNQAVGCSFTLTPTSITVPSAAANNHSFNITANNPACAWTATGDHPWISVNQDSRNGTGSKQINYSVLVNTGPARDGTITIASSGQTWKFNVTQQSGCTYNLLDTGASFPREGGSGTFNLTTNDQRCDWRATISSNATTWLSISGNSSGIGNATITFNVAENFVPSRTGTISIGNQTFTVNQSNGCRFTLSVPTTVEVGASAGSGTFSVNSGAGCTWSATSTDTTWLTITSGTSGTGTQTVTFNYTANPGPLRTARITINGNNGQQGGQVLTFTVNQANGCSFTVSPTSFTDVPAAGASRSVTVDASHEQCTWSATVEGNASWITITNGSNRTGDGALNFDVALNNGLQRNATLKIAGKDVSVTQADGCTYTLTPASMSLDELGGQRFFDVTVSNAQCSWTAVPTATWITIDSGSSGTGNNRVTFTVGRNPTDDERNGKISVGGVVAANRKDFTITQVSLTVRTIEDDGPGSLRRAVQNANRSASNDVITFAPSLPGNTIVLSSGEIKIENSVTSGTLEIRGPGAQFLTVSGGGTSRIFYIDRATVTIKGLTLSGGNGVGEMSSSFRKAGGAVYVFGGSTTFSGVNITGNSIMEAEPGQGTLNNGGGIYFEKGDSHKIENSSISFNSSANGGGITNIGDLSAQGLSIFNTTIANNQAAREGGGIYNAGNGFMRNVTIVNNRVTSPIGTGAGLGVYSGVIEIGNTIIAENIGPDITKDFSGSPVSLGHNLFGDSPEDLEKIGTFPYVPTDLKGVKPLTSVIGQFGGPTNTVALMSGSPAIDAGKNENAPPPPITTDQRGSPRVLGTRVDIGAFEHNMRVTPVNQTLPGGVANEFYSGQQIRGERIPPDPMPEQYRHELIDGELPPGMRMENGFITGTPTFQGRYEFAVKVTGSANEWSGANKFTLIVGCGTSLSPQSQEVNPVGGDFLINVTAPGCNWNAAPTVNWITIVSPNGGNGNSNGAVTYRVATNTGGARTGKIRIGNAEFTVNQAAASNCSFSIAPDSANFTSAGGNGSFALTTEVGCSWQANSNQTWVSFPSNSATGTGSGTVSFNVARNMGAVRTATITVGGKTYSVNQAAARTAFDFDGDGIADPAVFRQSNASWYILKSISGFEGLQFGTEADKPVPADYDGDGKTDVAVYRPSNGAWYYNRSSDGQFVGKGWGIETDIPVPGDYDGDGKADFAVFRSGNWYILQSSNEQFRAVQFGFATDKPVPADYDGDGKTDIAVFRQGAWYWLRSAANDEFAGMQFGIAGDKPVVADYDGDGLADPSVIRDAIWYFNKTTEGFSGMQFGVASDTPTPADFDGDGKTDVAVFRDGAWYYNSSRNGTFNGVNWGLTTDKPIQSVFIP